MTLLSYSGSSARRDRLRRFRPVRALLTLIAVLQARAALARITRRKAGSSRDVPAYLRRDLGLPEVDQTEWAQNHITILSYLRLK